jgi:glycosyltransferase involved in cell wall biosynthesis
MTKYKVLHIITRLDKGGSAENTLLTVTRIDKSRFHSTLASGPTSDPQGKNLASIKQESIDYILIPELVRSINPLKDIIAFFKLWRIIKKGKFDVVHTHTSKAGMLGRWAAKLAGAKIIVHTPHGHVFYGYFNKALSRVFVYLERLTAIITDKIVILTKRGIEEYLQYKIAQPEKFVAIYSGIDVERLKTHQSDKVKEKQRLGIPADSSVLGTVTRLDPVKGNKYLFEALPEIVKSIPRMRLIVVGEGKEKEALARYVREQGCSENVLFLGMQEGIASIVNTFDIFILPSLMEGMGKSLLEAQALGIPVVATKVGGIPEVVKDGETGILVPAKDSHAIAGAVIRLLQDEALRRRFSENAKQWVDKRFSIETMVNDISGLYEQLLSAKK